MVNTQVTPVTPTKPKTNENIYLFVPNLIGYSRVVLAAASLTYMSTHPKFCTFTYVISCLLDAVDGQAARALGQTSRLGAILDMVTDRCTTSCLLCFLASTYTPWALLFQGLISLDFASHYIHMYASLVSGSTSHKSVTKKQSRILWLYYNNSNVLFAFCAGNEAFFVALYLLKWYKTALLPTATGLHVFEALTGLGVPALVAKAVAGVTFPQIIAGATFPVMFLKQAINCVQIGKAAQLLVDADLEERWEKQHGKSK